MLMRSILIILLFSAVWLVRSIYTMPIEKGGDALKKWIYVCNFSDPSVSFLSDHHTMRWAVNLPGVAFHRSFGDFPSSYYLAPITAFSAGFIVLCALAWSAFGFRMVPAFAIALFLEPMMFRASSQFQPIVFGFVYASISVYFAMWWSTKRTGSLLFMSAAFLFLAYGSHESHILFLPGLLFFVYKVGTVRDSIFAILVFVALFTIEVLVFNLFSQQELPFGRLSAIAKTHALGGNGADNSYVDYFLMWLKVSWFNRLISLLAVVPFLWFCIFSKLNEIPKLLILLGGMIASFHFLNTFFIVDFRNMMTPQEPLQRYLAVTMPFACLAAFGCVHWLGSHFQRAWIGWCGSFATGVLLASHVVFGVQPAYRHNGLHYPSQDAFLYRVNEHYQTGASWLRDGNFVSTNHLHNAKALKVLMRPYFDSNEVIQILKLENEFLLYVSRDSILDSSHVVDSKRIWTYRFSQHEFDK